MRSQHYAKQVEDNKNIRASFHHSKSMHKMSPFKQKQISNMLKDIQSNAQKLTEREKLLEKRYELGR